MCTAARAFFLLCHCPLTLLPSHRSNLTHALQYRVQQHRKHGRLRACSHPEGDNDLQPRVRRHPKSVRLSVRAHYCRRSRVFALVSAPADTKANTFLPSPCTCVRKRTRSLSEHIPCLALQNLPALARKRTHPLPSPSTRCHPPPCAAWTEATSSSCRTAGSRVRPRPSHTP